MTNTEETTLSVLLLDDERGNLDTFKRTFRKEFNLKLSEDPVSAVDLLRRTKFDVILADQTMPNMTGVEFLHQARDIQPQAVRVLITAHADLPEVRGAHSGGLSAAVIMKPWSKEEVLRVVKYLTEVSRMRAAVSSLQTSVGTPGKDSGTPPSA